MMSNADRHRELQQKLLPGKYDVLCYSPCAAPKPGISDAQQMHHHVYAHTNLYIVERLTPSICTYIISCCELGIESEGEGESALTFAVARVNDFFVWVERPCGGTTYASVIL